MNLQTILDSLTSFEKKMLRAFVTKILTIVTTVSFERREL